MLQIQFLYIQIRMKIFVGGKMYLSILLFYKVVFWWFICLLPICIPTHWNV